MVDVGQKPISQRSAIAVGTVLMQPATIALIKSGGHKKGDVISVARIAGIQAAKKCADLIPLCHSLALSNIRVDFEITDSGVNIEAECSLADRTGVEMEALTAVSVAALTLFDMCKAVDKTMIITDVRVIKKTKEHV